MDDEKKYKEALERARKELRACGSQDCDAARQIFRLFPELKESEDEEEKIRKGLKQGFSQYGNSFTTFGGIKVEDIIAWLEKQGESEDKGEISDGYHTFNELYRYRLLYNAAFFNLLPKELVHKSKKHHDGEECFGGGWFIVMANLPTGQISNHYELKDWDLFQIPEKDVADEWDGHTPQEAAERLHKYLLEKQGEQKPDENKPNPRFAERRVGFITGAMWADSHPHWISVEDELPPKESEYEDNSIVVLATDGNDVYKGLYRSGEFLSGWLTCDLWALDNITHWMPLPQPPVLSNSENTGRDLKGGEQ